MKYVILIISICLLFPDCQNTVKNNSSDPGNEKAKLVVLDPAHFHAALALKYSNPEIDKNIEVYAPEGNELNSYLATVKSYNHRPDNPTDWNLNVYTGNDFLEKMLKNYKGNTVVLAGNNQTKIEYISKSIEAGLNVLSDKPMVINYNGFKKLEKAYEDASKNRLVLYDMMTERYQITNKIQRILINSKELFGELTKGTPENPAIESESTHHFLKTISGNPLIRPAWYYDVEQQGEGIVDVTTHLIDIINYNCFHEKVINYQKNVIVNDANRYPTKLSLGDYKFSTGEKEYPDYIQKDVINDTLHVYSNGDIQYTVNGVHIKINVLWNLKAPKGSGDTHKIIVRGTKATIFILQGVDQNYNPELYVVKNANISQEDFEHKLSLILGDLQKDYAGISCEKKNEMIKIVIPDALRTAHESHFSQVVETFIGYMQNQNMPEWESYNTLAKYYITTKALEIAKKKYIK